MIDAVIFDVDGTLVDSNDAHIRAWQRAFGRVGRHIAYEALQQQMGKGADNLVPALSTPEEVKKYGAEVKRLHVEIYVRHYLPDVQPFDRVRELFEAIRSAGMRIALATSATGKELEHNVRTLGIDGLFEYATSADEVERSKPCPDVFEAALAGLPGVRAERAIAVGDTPYDAQAAGRIGLRTVGVLSGGFSAERLRSAGAVAIYGQVGELRDELDLLRRGYAAAGPR